MNIKESFCNTWKEKTFLYEKVAYIIGLLCAICVVVLGILYFTGVMDNLMNLMGPFISISLLTQGILNWKKNRSLALFSFGVAVFVAASSVYILVIHPIGS